MWLDVSILGRSLSKPLLRLSAYAQMLVMTNQFLILVSYIFKMMIT